MAIKQAIPKSSPGISNAQLLEFCASWQGTKTPLSLLYEGMIGEKKLFDKDDPNFSAETRQDILVGLTVNIAIETLMHDLLSRKEGYLNRPDWTSYKGKIIEQALNLIAPNQKRPAQSLFENYFNDAPGFTDINTIIRQLRQSEMFKKADDLVRPGTMEAFHKEAKDFTLMADVIADEVAMWREGLIAFPNSIKELKMPKDPRAERFNSIAQEISAAFDEPEPIVKLRESGPKYYESASQKFQEKSKNSSEMRDICRSSVIVSRAALADVFNYCLRDNLESHDVFNACLATGWKMQITGNFDRKTYVAIPRTVLSPSIEREYSDRLPKGFVCEIKVQTPKMLTADLMSHRCYRAMRFMCGRKSTMDHATAKTMVEEHQAMKADGEERKSMLSVISRMMRSMFNYFENYSNTEFGQSDALIYRDEQGHIKLDNLEDPDAIKPRNIERAFKRLYNFTQHMYTSAAMESGDDIKKLYLESAQEKNRTIDKPKDRIPWSFLEPLATATAGRA